VPSGSSLKRCGLEILQTLTFSWLSTPGVPLCPGSRASESTKLTCQRLPSRHVLGYRSLVKCFLKSRCKQGERTTCQQQPWSQGGAPNDQNTRKQQHEAYHQAGFQAGCAALCLVRLVAASCTAHHQESQLKISSAKLVARINLVNY
jgi:hypothetical protein